MRINSVAVADSAAERHEKWLRALEQLTATLALLDESSAPPEVGAELDMAIYRLQCALEHRDRTSSSAAN